VIVNARNSGDNIQIVGAGTSVSVTGTGLPAVQITGSKAQTTASSSMASAATTPSSRPASSPTSSSSPSTAVPATTPSSAATAPTR
jgi:hypothetical protein